MREKMKHIFIRLLVISLIMSLLPFQVVEAKGIEKIVTYSEEAFWRNYYACYGEKDTFDLIIRGPEAKKVFDRTDEAWEIESNLFKEYHDKNKIYQGNMLAAWFAGMTIERKISNFSPNDSKLTMHFKSERLEIFRRFEKYVNPAIEIALPALKEMHLEEMNDYERIYTVSRWLAKRCKYDWDYYNYLELGGSWQERFADYHAKSKCAYEAIVNKRGVCAAYADATYFLLKNMGYDVVYIHGKAYGGEHAWNYVRLDGKWYALDNTWNDTDDGDEFRTDYFLIGADTFYLDHTASAEDMKNYPLAETAYHGNSKIELPPTITGKTVNAFPKEDKVEFPSIKIDKSIYLLSVGKSIKPIIKIKNPNNEKITYTSSNKKVASVSNDGKIKAKKKGVVTITVRVGENSAKKFKVKIKS